MTAADYRLWASDRGVSHGSMGCVDCRDIAEAEGYVRDYPRDDRQALEGLQSLILCLCGDCPAEPGFDLLTIPDRPLLATVPILAAPSPDMGTIADAETCLAAAFFLHVIGGD